jgi:hypothetical protein
MAEEDLAGLAERLRAAQRQDWRGGCRQPAEDYLARHPALGAAPELALELRAAGQNAGHKPEAPARGTRKSSPR